MFSQSVPVPSSSPSRMTRHPASGRSLPAVPFRRFRFPAREHQEAKRTFLRMCNNNSKCRCLVQELTSGMPRRMRYNLYSSVSRTATDGGNLAKLLSEFHFQFFFFFGLFMTAILSISSSAYERKRLEPTRGSQNRADEDRETHWRH
jgi:hypothetical protein